MPTPTAANRLGRKINAAVQTGSLYMVGAMPVPGKPDLIRSTRALIKFLWIASIILMPVGIGMICLAFLREPEWFTTGPVRFSLYKGAEITAALATRVVGDETVLSLPSISLTGLLTVLLIFALAQIFEKGSNMRAELQETI